MSGAGEDKDYMTISLKNGAIHVAIDLGSGAYNEAVDMGGYKLDDGQWHHVVVVRNSRQVSYYGNTINLVVMEMLLVDFL